MIRTNLKIAATALAVASAFASTAYAAGFQLTEQSALALGRAYAGVGVDGTDVSGMYYNPATMTLHPGTQVQLGAVGVGLNLEYVGHDAEYKENGRAKEEVLPHGYISHQINDTTWVGLALTIPYGLATEYDSNWEHQELGTDAKITVINFNPNFAWKATDTLSFGAGLALQYVDAKFGVGVGPENLHNAGSIHNEYSADGFTWGFNLGMMWAPTENFRLGVSYRSKIKHDAEGDFTLKKARMGNTPVTGDALIERARQYPAENETRAQLMTLGAVLNRQSFDGYATVTAPAWAMANVAWDVNDLLSLYGTFRWTDWSSFDELDITTNVTGVGGQVVNKWKDTYMGSVGADLRLTNWWTLRGGIAYETSPIDKPEYRTAIIPDARRWWFAVGSSFKFDDNLMMDLAFAHLHGVGERSLYENGEKIGKFRKLDAYLIGAQLQYKF